MTEKEKRIIASMRDMLASGKDLTLSGKPEVGALSVRVDFHVSAAVRDMLLVEILAPAPEEPEPEPEKVSMPDPMEWRLRSGVKVGSAAGKVKKMDAGARAKAELKKNPRPAGVTHRIGKARR